jgi:hypothetical protein
MTNKFEKKETIECCGRLDKDEHTGEYFISVETKDSVETFSVNMLLKEMLGSQVSFKSEYHTENE